MRFALVFIGGGIGALLRYLISLWAAAFFPRIFSSQWGEFPFGTFIANIIPSFVIGLILGIDFLRALPLETKLFVGIGICGGLSTFSSFAGESMNLLREKYYFLFALNIILNNIFTIGFALLGFMLGKRIGGIQ